jgi:hypothetical protein
MIRDTQFVEQGIAVHFLGPRVRLGEVERSALAGGGITARA